MARITCSAAWLLLVLTACRFEADDTAFVPQTLASYVLAQDSITHHNHLLRYAMGQAHMDWQDQLGLASGNLGGLAGREAAVWVGSNQPGTLLRLDAASGLLAQTYDLDTLRSHWLVAGDQVLLVCDTVARMVGLLGLESGGLVQLPVAAKPGPPQYRGGQFYVPVGNEVWVFQAEARALLARVRLARPVTDLQPDWRSTIWTYTRQGDTLWKAGIEYHSHLVNDPSIPQPGLVKERYSPYRQVNYGTERSNNVRLANNGRIGTQGRVVDFEYDFFEQTLFFQRGDTLFRQARQEPAFPMWQGMRFRLLTSFHYQGSPSDG